MAGRPDGPGSPTAEDAGGRHAGSRTLAVQVHLLDDTVATFNVQYKALGRVLFDQVCRVINLLEVDYFGLEYADSGGTKYWLDNGKPMCRQMGLSLVSPVMEFAVKFYTPDPAQLEEEFTRYLFSLQIKKDLAQGVLQCSDPTAALLASYIVQASCGDYVAEDYPDASYLSSHKFVPQQDSSLEARIMECHQRHVGQSPAQADLNLLETARRCELYGVRLSPARDPEGLLLQLAVAHMGVMVFQGATRINTFSWARIRKLSFKRRRFLIKLHPEGYGYYKDTVEYFFENRNECKNFWKKCIENHAFFRCTEVKKSPRQKARLFSRGSSFRYSGRTQKQIVEYVRENYVKRQPFQRSTSLRLPSHGSTGVSDDEDIEPVALTTTATSEPSSPRRDVSRETPPRPAEGGAVTPSQDTDDNISHDSYRLEEGDSSITAPTPSGDSSIALDLSPPAAATLALCSPPSAPPVEENREEQELEDNNNSSHCSSSDGTTAPPSSKMDPPGYTCKRVFPPEYFIGKELLMTERSYRKDLEVVVVAFRDWAEKQGSTETAPLFSLLAPVYKLHCALLHELEQQLAAWDGKAIPVHTSKAQGVGSLMLDYLHLLELDERYLEKLPRILERLFTGPQSERLCREFERQRDCYLPLSQFLLRPIHRVFHYRTTFERLHGCYALGHADMSATQDVLQQLKSFTTCHEEALHRLENHVKMTELERDLFGLDNLVQPGREFVREGCLQKLSRKGYQQRMFFLFSDVLIYASRSSSSSSPGFPPRPPPQQQQFKVHGQLPLQGLMVEETEPKAEAAFRFTIYAANRALMVAAGSEEERQRWMRDLSNCIETARDHKGLYYTSLKSCHSSDERLDRPGGDAPRLASMGQSPVHATTTLHLCWHRNTSIGRYQYQQAFLHYLSGYLLRKFKNSSGWQKLWVVFCNFSLFFYKSFQESAPLASLPLLGYTVALPGDQMGGKQHVFKLQYRSHVYFFRAESEYAFQRWMHVISSAAVKKKP